MVRKESCSDALFRRIAKKSQEMTGKVRDVVERRKKEMA